MRSLREGFGIGRRRRARQWECGYNQKVDVMLTCETIRTTCKKVKLWIHKKKKSNPIQINTTRKDSKKHGRKEKKQEEHQVVEFIQVKGKGNQKGVQKNSEREGGKKGRFKNMNSKYLKIENRRELKGKRHKNIQGLVAFHRTHDMLLASRLPY